MGWGRGVGPGHHAVRGRLQTQTRPDAAQLQDHYEIIGADGAFYMFIKAPWGTATDFVKKAIENELLIIPGNVFSSEDTHFRISYAAKDETLLRGAEVLRKIAQG